jgi:hypothetical protein
MTAIRLEQVTKGYNATVALDAVYGRDVDVVV